MSLKLLVTALLDSKPKVDRDWQYEQVRSEIKRLREVLRNPNLTDEERTIAQSQLDNYITQDRAK